VDHVKIRADFPALRKWVYLDNAFVGLIPKQVKEGYDAFVDRWINFKTEGTRTILDDWLDQAAKTRDKTASLIGVSKHEIAFTMCTGSGLNVVVNGTDWVKGDNTVFPEWEHNPLDTHITRRYGVQPRVWHQVGGEFRLSDLENLVDDSTRIVQVSQVSYVNGFRLNLREVAEIAHEHGAKVLVDATQAVGALQVDYKKDGVDYVAVAPYKYLMGPAGLAFLYVKEENISELTPDRTGWKNQIFEGDNPEESTIVGSAEKFEYGTLNFQGIYALEKSIDYLNMVGMGNVENQVIAVTKHLYDELNSLGKEVWTPEGNESPIVSYKEDNAVDLAAELMRSGIKVTGRKAHGSHMRISAHFYNTDGDVGRFMEGIKQ